MVRVDHQGVSESAPRGEAGAGVTGAYLCHGTPLRPLAAPEVSGAVSPGLPHRWGEAAGRTHTRLEGTLPAGRDTPDGRGADAARAARPRHEPGPAQSYAPRRAA